jgi:hypothetical protein
MIKKRLMEIGLLNCARGVCRAKRTRVRSWVYAYPCMVEVSPCEKGERKRKGPKAIMFFKRNKKT